MPIVHLEWDTPEARHQREYPEFPCQIGPLRFSSDQAGHADWLLKAMETNRPFQTRVPRERRILLLHEPDGYYPPAFVNQFGIIVSPHDVPGRTGIWYQSHPAIGSLLGVTGGAAGGCELDYQARMSLPIPAKRDGLSVVTSMKSTLPGHRTRLRFLDRLEGALGSRLVRFGRGFRAIVDKAEAIFPYKYHLVLENTSTSAYWSEKLADAYIGYAFPIVWGPPDLERWFHRDSFQPIDITDPDRAIATIVQTMDNHTYEQRLDAICRAREHLMAHERLFQVIARVIAAHPNVADRLASPATIEPLPKRSLPVRLGRNAARTFWQAAMLLNRIRDRQSRRRGALP
jgi:hypothetical protein